ncbi:MAG: AAA domain-containing protein [Pseudoflavonifractor sp.]|nr:AAA domain-containing protein [Alloprevotella sp.]MCM1117129.1 AAA domain-containing protein [Pseudoflavonifractor sp.]
MTPADREIARLRALLSAEYEEEKEQYARLADRLGVDRLVARGHAWFPISIGRNYFNSLNQKVIEVVRQDDSDEGDTTDDHSFEYGRPLIFFNLGGDPASAPKRLLAGSVAYVDGSRMAITVPDDTNLALLSPTDGRVGVMLSFDETTFRVMFETLDRLASAKGRLGQLRDFVYGQSPAHELSLHPLRFPYLNPSQERGVNKVLRAKEVAIVHGPPGTGKTTTLVEAIHETLRRESQVMVCAQSNMAVDWICEKLVDRGINVLRLGNPSRVNDKMLSFTYERLFEAHADYSSLWSIRKAIRELRAHRRDTDGWHQKIDRLQNRAIELEIRINTDIFGSANVIASTLTGSASRLLEGMTFGTVFIDEAAQALEAATWIPMRRASRMVLAGDHCQLPPTVKSLKALREGLGCSLMERLAVTHPETVTLLTVQYRMRQEIMRFSSEWFYGGMVEAAPDISRRGGLLEFEHPITWIDASVDCSLEGSDPFVEEIASGSFGRINKAEAELTVKVLHDYVSRIGVRRILDESIDFGIISPYRAQVHYLRRLLKHEPWARRLRHLISVNTVDGFQGQERDVILLSLVRSNDSHSIGFLRDLRRMNVAITRTRHKLFIIGSVDTLAGAHPFYRRLAEYVGAMAPQTI